MSKRKISLRLRKNDPIVHRIRRDCKQDMDLSDLDPLFEGLDQVLKKGKVVDEISENSNNLLPMKDGASAGVRSDMNICNNSPAKINDINLKNTTAITEPSQGLENNGNHQSKKAVGKDYIKNLLSKRNNDRICYICSVCDLDFNSISALKLHCRHVHATNIHNPKSSHYQLTKSTIINCIKCKFIWNNCEDCSFHIVKTHPEIQGYKQLSSIIYKSKHFIFNVKDPRDFLDHLLEAYEEEIKDAQDVIETKEEINPTKLNNSSKDDLTCQVKDNVENIEISVDPENLMLRPILSPTMPDGEDEEVNVCDGEAPQLKFFKGVGSEIIVTKSTRVKSNPKNSPPLKSIEPSMFGNNIKKAIKRTSAPPTIVFSEKKPDMELEISKSFIDDDIVQLKRRRRTTSVRNISENSNDSGISIMTHELFDSKSPDDKINKERTRRLELQSAYKDLAESISSSLPYINQDFHTNQSYISKKKILDSALSCIDKFKKIEPEYSKTVQDLQNHQKSLEHKLHFMLSE